MLLTTNADDLQKMVTISNDYAEEHGLLFSTDPVPSKSKTKCLFINGVSANKTFPENINLKGLNLPWVATADHLGHTFNDQGNMSNDIRIKRATFIDKAEDICFNLDWAHPNEKLRSADIYLSSHYGSNLWLFQSKEAQMYFNSWNYFVKKSWKVPIMTHTYIVHNTLAKLFVPVQLQVLSRYIGFLKAIAMNPSKECRILLNIISNDKSSSVFLNKKMITEKCKDDPMFLSKREISLMLKREPVPENEKWRLIFLEKPLNQCHPQRRQHHRQQPHQRVDRHSLYFLKRREKCL